MVKLRTFIFDSSYVPVLELHIEKNYHAVDNILKMIIFTHFLHTLARTYLLCSS